MSSPATTSLKLPQQQTLQSPSSSASSTDKQLKQKKPQQQKKRPHSDDDDKDDEDWKREEKGDASNEDEEEDEEGEGEEEEEKPTKQQARKKVRRDDNDNQKAASSQNNTKQDTSTRIGVYSSEIRTLLREELISTASASMLPDLADIVLSYCCHSLLTLWESIETKCQQYDQQQGLTKKDETTFEYYAFQPNGAGENSISLAVSLERIDALERGYRQKLKDETFRLPDELKILWSIRDGVDRDREHSIFDKEEEDSDSDTKVTCYQNLFYCCLWPSISRVESILENSPTPLQSTSVLLVATMDDDDGADDYGEGEATSITGYDLCSGLFFSGWTRHENLKAQIESNADEDKDIDPQALAREFTSIGVQNHDIRSYHHLFEVIYRNVTRDTVERGENPLFYNFESLHIGVFGSQEETQFKQYEYDRAARFTPPQLATIEKRLQSQLEENVIQRYLSRPIEDDPEPIPCGKEWRDAILAQAQEWNAGLHEEDED